MIRGLEAQGLDAVAFDADSEYDDLDGAIAAVATPETDVLYQTGGFGIEPIVYVLAPTAENAAEHVRALRRNG